MQFTTLVLAALTSLASAERTWVVTVAKNGSLAFSPERLSPQPGEWVQFQFHAGNHTVTQSTFDQPCQPIGMHADVTGFHSGFLPVAASAEQGMIPTYTIQINDTNPIWLYCAQGPHCQRGMVMVINEPAANETRTLENYKLAAADAQVLAPGDSIGGGTTGSTDSPGTGSGTGTGTGGSGSGTDTDDAAAPGVTTAGAGMLTAPGVFALAAAGVAALLL